MKYIFSIFIVFCFCITVSLTQSSCRTPNGEIAYCVPIHSCEIFLTALPNLTPEIVTFLRKSQCGYENTKPLVCCGHTTKFEISTRFSELLPWNQSECGTFLYDKILRKPTSLAIEEFPWTALLEYKRNEVSTGYHCGGVIINNRYILTAAHCINEKYGKLFKVRLGEFDLNNNTKLEPGKSHNYDIEQIIIHPKYNINNKNQNDDIALIRVTKNINKTDLILPICLTYNNITNLNSIYFSSGWGVHENSEIYAQKGLEELTIVPRERCNSLNLTLTSSQLCVENSRKIYHDLTCRGDSGGGLVKEIEKLGYFLEGIESFRLKKCNNNETVLSVYTNIHHYLNWIVDNVKP